MTKPLKTILFDAAGTLVYPAEPVAVTYARIAGEFGLTRDTTEIDFRFRRRLKDFHNLPETTEKQRWRSLVGDVLRLPAELREPVFEQLWQHYALGSAWQVFDDAVPAWESLLAAGFQVGVASNFDARLLSVWKDLPLSQFPCQIFYSEAIGHAKPADEFFRHIEAELRQTLPDVTPDTICLVGDDKEADFRGAKSAGWQSLLIQRKTDRHSDDPLVISTLADVLLRVQA